MNSVIESMKAKGFTYLGIVEGEKIFCNLESGNSINNCLEFLGKITGEDWATFKEDSGNKNLVFYRASMFEVVDDCYLHFKGENKIELPLNCSSCFSMFFDCKLPEGFSLGDKFDTSKIVNMEQMFHVCSLPEGFSLGNKFDTSRVKNMYGMFGNCKLPEGFSLGDKFDTSRVEDMGYMFFDCKLPEGFSLSDKFDISNVISMGRMFSKCALPEGKSAEDFNSEIEIIEWLKCRGKQGTNKQSTSKLSAF